MTIINIMTKLNGTFTDCGGLIVASVTGSLLGSKFIPKKVQGYVMEALGAVCILLGIVGATDMKKPLICILSFVMGSVLGNLLNIEKRMNSLGDKIFKHIFKGKLPDKFVSTMVCYALMSITGSMAIAGPIENALSGKTDILLAKTILDIVAGFFFASSHGPGVIASSLIIFVYQAFFGVFALVVSPIMTPEVIGNMSAIGSILIGLLGINIIYDTKVSIMNFTPCIFAPILLHLLELLIQYFK